MTEIFAAYWYVIAIALVIAVASGWWVAANRIRVRLSDRDRRLDTPAVPLAPTLARATPTTADVPPAAVMSSEVPAASLTLAGSSDDLRQLKGVGPKLVALLGTLGITRFNQIAVWSADDIAAIDAQLGAFKGRIERDDWVGQARLLVAGDVAGFEAKFGALGGS